ncbi:hypothetical protein F5Y13DRAFT_161507 [Hypoxylon sp. FL1857]|nr:hypothetical protein F5Y13DRAFT_161507 [Hypoxylon sp. FL1857]
MPLQSLISRLKSTKKPQDRERNTHEEESCNDVVEEPSTSSQQTEQTERTAQSSTQRLEVNEAESVKGLRKPSVSGRRSLNQEIPSRSTDSEPSASDYLYFGEGTSAADVSQSLLNRSRSKSVGNTPGQPPTGNWNQPTKSGGRDQSGFLSTGLNTQTTQMGYSNLTYGGSLQYDYAGTQAPGFG